MPSANFTYSPTNKINLRLAYNKTVIRPQFNERTGLPYFDPDSQRSDFQYRNGIICSQ
jgi:outer membrane receptor protein involved in Fe transport